MDEQPRESGRFAQKPKAAEPEPARERTATEILADAKSQSRSDGHLIPQPLPWDELNDVVVFHGLLGTERSAQWHGNTARLEAMKAWIKETANHPEGLSGDLWKIWQTWNPSAPKAKGAIRHWFDQLDIECKLKEGELGRRREAEQQPIRARQGVIAWAMRCRSALEMHDAKRAPLAADLEKALAAVEAIGATMPGELPEQVAA